MRIWMNVSEGAEYAGVSRDTIYTACGQGELRHAHVGGRRSIRLRPAWIDAWLEKHAVEVGAGGPADVERERLRSSERKS